MPNPNKKPPASPQHKLDYAKQYYRDNKDRQVELAQKWREQHPGQVAELAKTWRQSNPDYVKNYMRQRREGLVGPFSADDGPDWQARNREEYLRQKRSSTNRRRREVCLEALQVYSPKSPPCCYCCGETEPMLLGLDHINGGGNKHRKELGITHPYQWAKRNKWPPIFRVACHSCNLGSHLNGGTCPHQKET